MSKLQTLKKQVIREASIVGGAVVASVVLMMATGSFSDSAVMEKDQAQNEYNQSESQLGMMRSQISKSADAEKRYIDMRVDRDNDDFINNTDNLKELLRGMKDKYRFSDAMRLTISNDKISEKPEFQTLNYKVVVREDMEIATGAISDMHVYSFLQEMQRRMPGILRITHFKLDRKSPLSIENLTQLSTGAKVEMVDAAIKFTWLTLEDKNLSKEEPAAVNPEGVPQ